MASGFMSPVLPAITNTASSKHVPVTHQNRCFNRKRKTGSCGSLGDGSELVGATLNAEFLSP